MTFGEKLQKLRRGSGLSQEQLAEKLDCPVVAGSLRSGYWEKIK